MSSLRSRARCEPLASGLFRVLNLLELGLDLGQGPEDLRPGCVLILQAVRARGMMHLVQGGVTFLAPFAFYGFLEVLGGLW
jgi:hypothetical protein